MRRFSLKRHRAGAVCAFALLAATRTALADLQFSLLDLGTLGGVRSEAFDINNSGVVVGWARNPTNGVRAFRTAPNSPINPLTDGFAPLAGGTYSVAYSVNASGQFTGDSGSSNGDRAYRYSGTTMTPINPFQGSWSYGTGINNLGHVVGGASVKNIGPTHAFLYNGTSKFDLGELANNSDSFARAINNSGRVVGYAVDANYLERAFIWTPTVPNGTTGTMVNIGTLGGTSTYAWSINDNNVVVGGSSTTGDLAYHAFKYEGGAYTDLGTLGGAASDAFDINNNGDIVGQADIAGNLPRAYLYRDGTMHNLNDLLDPAAAGWTLTVARAINDNGQIVGYGVAPDGQTRGFVLTPSIVAPPESTWQNDINGDWSVSANWLGGVPNSVGAIANFGSAIQVNRYIFVDAPQTVGRINFNNANSYTLDGSSIITMQTSSGNAQINVAEGNHDILTPLHLAVDTTMDVAPATSTLNLAGGVTAAAGAGLHKQGAGTLFMNHVRVAALNVSGGAVRIAPNGSDDGVSVVQSVAISGGGKVDVADNALIITDMSVGSWNGSAYTGVAGLVQAGSNGGTWTGSGILTSMTDASSSLLATLAVASADDIGLAGGEFRGQTVNSGDVLVVFTWGGDANLNGELDGDDYFVIDSNIVNSGSIFGFNNGDFNYDGLINGDDYFIIDSNISIAQGSGAIFGTLEGPARFAAVPEPASIIACGVLVAGAVTRRRRR